MFSRQYIGKWVNFQTLFSGNAWGVHEYALCTWGAGKMYRCAALPAYLPSRQ